MGEKPRLTVGALIFNSDGKVLLLKSHKWGGRYVNPCGHVKFMERLEDAVRREIREETGLEIKNIQFLRVLEFINPEQYHKKNLHFVGVQYVCEAREGIVRINKEAEEYLWVYPSKAVKMDLEWGARKAIEYFLSNR